MIVHIIVGKLKLQNSNGVINVVHNLALNQCLYENIEVWGISNKNYSDNTRPYILKIFKSICFSFLCMPLIKKIFLYRKQIDIIHFHGGWNIEFFHIALILKIFKIKYIISPHGAYNKVLLKRKSFYKKIFFKTIVKLYLRGAHKIHLFSEDEIENVELNYSNKKILIAPNGVDEQKYTIKNIKNNYGATTITFCGRLQNKHKATHKLIEGFSIYLNSSDTDVRLSIIGDGPDKKSLIELSKRLGVNNKIDFHGSLYGDKKIEVLQNADAFILVSNYEGMPIAALEAASLGKFLILTDACNLGSYVKKYNTGISVKSNCPIDVSNAIRFFMESKGANENFTDITLENNLKMIRNEFNWNTISKNLLNDYK